MTGSPGDAGPLSWGIGARMPPAKRLLMLLVMATTYFLAARYALELLANPNGVAVFWPASGLAVGAILAFGMSCAWPIAGGVALGTIAANLVGGRAPLLLPFFAAANVLECLAVAWITDRFLGPHVRFDTLRRVLGVFFGAVVGASAGGAVGAFALVAIAHLDGSIFVYWSEWLRSDLIGIIAITPAILGLKSIVSKRLPLSEHIEGLLLVSLVSATAISIYPGILTSDAHWQNPPEALLFPPLLMLAIRQPLTYAPIGASMIALVIVASTISEASHAASVDVKWSQIAIISMVACSLSLAALIAERRASDARQRSMNAELDHRVKNGLALVQAIVERSRESASSIEDFYAALGGRISSMAKTHSMLSREHWRSLALADLITNELAPFQPSISDTLRGPHVMLAPALAQSLGLVLHELSTNAAKYGALSTSGGRVSVSWSVETALDGETDLVIEWRESGSEAISQTGPPGFGTTTIRDLLRYEANAIILLSFPPDGATCTIRLPKSAAEFTVG